MRWWVPFSAVLAPVALIGGWTVGAARQPAGYDAARDTISALAAHGAHDPWVMTTGLAVLGGAHVATALGLVEASAPSRVLMGVGGAAAALVAVFPQPSAGHFPAATVSFVALAVWPALSDVPSRAAGRLAALGLVGTLVWFATQLGGSDVLGLSERVVAGAEALWPMAAVAVLGARRAGR